MYSHLLSGESSLSLIRRDSVFYHAVCVTHAHIKENGFMQGLRVREYWNKFVIENWSIPLEIDQWYRVFWLSLSYKFLSEEDYINHSNIRKIMLRR